MASNTPERLQQKVEWLRAHTHGTLLETLGIELEELDCEHVTASMPVDARTKQPHGLLHGGASLALAESLASIGAWLNVDETRFGVVAMEINANHVRPVTRGYVRGHARPVHRGGSMQVWEIMIYREDGELNCVSRCTLVQVPAAKKE